jgi:hypothetical protein|tara:strand:- start:205 stop:444 length:240 start_codon:yes stop_codon:yes gene_type:complete
MKISFEERMKLLKAHNELRAMLVMIGECHDIYMSDIGKLEDAVYNLENIFKFEPPKDKEGNVQYYRTDWLLADETNQTN